MGKDGSVVFDEEVGTTTEPHADVEDESATKKEKRKTRAKNKKSGEGEIVKAAKEFHLLKAELIELKAKKEDIDSRINQIESELLSLKEKIKGDIEKV